MIFNIQRRYLVVFGLVCFGLGATLSGFIFNGILYAMHGGQLDDKPDIIEKQVTVQWNDATAEKWTNGSMSEETEEKVRYEVAQIEV